MAHIVVGDELHHRLKREALAAKVTLREYVEGALAVALEDGGINLPPPGSGAGAGVGLAEEEPPKCKQCGAEMRGLAKGWYCAEHGKMEE